MGFLPLQHTQTRLLLLLSNCTKYDHELTLHKIVNAKNWACMCALLVHILVRVRYTICAHGYQSVYLEGLSYSFKWVCDKWFKVTFFIWLKIYWVNKVIDTKTNTLYKFCKILIHMKVLNDKTYDKWLYIFDYHYYVKSTMYSIAHEMRLDFSLYGRCIDQPGSSTDHHVCTSRQYLIKWINATTSAR